VPALSARSSTRWASCTASPGDALAAAAVAEYAVHLAAKPFRPLAEMKARINQIARTGI
jgi:hypothetical protein